MGVRGAVEGPERDDLLCEQRLPIPIARPRPPTQTGPMATPLVVHCWTHLRSLGGVQSMLRRHLQRDPPGGLPTRALILFEEGPFPEVPVDSVVSGLGLDWRHSGRALRRQVASAPLPTTGRSLWVYHDLWALPTLADLDRSERRIGILHSHRAQLDHLLRRCEGLLDGVLGVSESLVALARDCLPGLEPDRVRWIPYPVDPPQESPPARCVADQELVLGYAGRIQRPQKRVDRIAGIGPLLEEAGIPHRWEFLGGGSAAIWLQQSLASAGCPAVFHGVQSGDGYWRRLAGWDAIVFTSDFEGLPITLLEAMSQGVVPVYPDLDDGGGDYARRISPALVYSPGNVRQAAQVVQWLCRRSPAERRVLSERAKSLAAPHVGDAYGQTFRNFVSSVGQRPRVSIAGADARRPHPGEWIPYGWLRRLPPPHPLRRGYA